MHPALPGEPQALNLQLALVAVDLPLQIPLVAHPILVEKHSDRDLFLGLPLVATAQAPVLVLHLVEQHPDPDPLLNLQLVAMAEALALILPRHVVDQSLAEPQALNLQPARGTVGQPLQIPLVAHPIVVE